MNDRLYRSRDERMFAGVAGGVAERLDLDPSLVRVVWLILIFLTGGLFFLLYVVMAIVVPEAPAGADQWANWPASSAPAAPGAVAGWSNPAAPAAAFAAAGPTAGGDVPEPPTGSDATGATPSGTPDVAAPGAPPAAATQPPPAQPAAPLAPPPAWSPAPYRHDRRRGGGALIGGLILILIGGYFLVRTLFPAIAIGSFWPALLVIIGIALIVGSLRPNRG